MTTTIVDLEEAWLGAKAELDGLFDELTYQFYKPQAQLAVGIAAAGLKDQEAANLPPGGVDRIIQYVLGGKDA